MRIERTGHYRWMTNTLSALAVILLPALALSLRAGDEPTKSTSVWMNQKLLASQAVLTALARGDFNGIETNAKAMSLVEILEKAFRADTPGYRTQLRLFEFADRELIRAAQEKNLEAATLAFNQLTISCVSCHKIVRDGAK
jgi:hypothetical protein